MGVHFISGNWNLWGDEQSAHIPRVYKPQGWGSNWGQSGTQGLALKPLFTLPPRVRCKENRTKDHSPVSALLSEDDEIWKALVGSLENTFWVKWLF